MAGRGTSLGPLLIISAIDLLLCCLTAAVMLFLIFQPSQRTDRSSALFQGTSGAESAQQLDVGGQAPTIVIVENRGETRLVVAPSSDYQAIESRSSKSTIYRSLGPAATLRLVPEDSSKRFLAHIVVTKGGKLFSNNWGCAGGTSSEVIVNPTSESLVEMTCPSTCATAGKANKPGCVHLVLIPGDAAKPASVPNEKCFALRQDESFENIRTSAANCGPDTTFGQEIFSSSELCDCLWKSFQESTPLNCEQIKGDRVGFWLDTPNPMPTEQICPVSVGGDGGGG